MADFEWLVPDTLDGVKHALSSGDMGTRLIGGGTALSLIMKQGIFQPERLVSLKKIKSQLNFIRHDEVGNLHIGALATLREVEKSQRVAETAPVIVKALHQVSNPRIRYVASIGGNLSYGDAHLDLPPILLAMDAKVKAESLSGERWIHLKDFFRGYYETALEMDEILTEIFIPKPKAGIKGVYIKYTTLSNDDWPTLGVAAFLKTDDQGIVSDSRLVVSAVADVPLRLNEVEQIILGTTGSDEVIEKAAQKAFDDVDPLEDQRGSAWYKKEMVKVHVRRAIRQLLSRE